MDEQVDVVVSIQEKADEVNGAEENCDNKIQFIEINAPKDTVIIDRLPSSFCCLKGKGSKVYVDRKSFEVEEVI